MSIRRSATQLAQAVNEERMDFDDALEEYLRGRYPDWLDINFFWAVKLAICYAHMGEWQKELPLPDNETLTVKQVIDRFGLEPFVER